MNTLTQYRNLYWLLLALLLLLNPLKTFSATISDFNPNAHWDCEETSGVRYDATTNTNDLTDNNSVLYGTGLLSNACDFESTNLEYLSITDADQIGLDTSTYSISFWYKPESSGGNIGFAGRGTSGTKSWDFQISSNVIYYASWDSGGGNAGNFSKAYTFSNGTWYHIVLIRDVAGNNCDLYINGTDQSVTCTGTVTTVYDSSQEVRFGWANTNYLDGLIDEISYFPTALSGSDVTTLYNSGTPLAYGGGSPPAGTSTSATTTSFEDDNIVFSLALIVFLLSFLVIGFIMSIFRKRV